ncbi:MAG TPA: D-2-hydroxyacid dehydrogenase [Candidatus Aquilonibacter sp.]
MTRRPTILIYHEQVDEIWAGLRDAGIDAEFLFASNLAQARAQSSRADALVALDPEITEDLVSGPRLRWIQALTSGMERVLGMPGIADGVALTSMRGAHGPQVSELAFLLMLAVARRFPAMVDNQRRRVWDHWRQPPLYQRTVTIVGVGAIASALAPRCKAFEMTVIGVDDRASEAPHFDRIYPPGQLHEALAAADFVVLLVPHVPATHHLIDAPALAAMRPHAILINVARGAIVDEAALIDALQHGTIAGAGLDVFATEPLPPESPLWAMDNVTVTPHVGGNSTSYIQQMNGTLVHNLRAFVDGRDGDLRNRIERV